MNAHGEVQPTPHDGATGQATPPYLDQIRRAAQLMRERAQAATPGPWSVGNDTVVGSEIEQTGPHFASCSKASEYRRRRS